MSKIKKKHTWNLSGMKKKNDANIKKHCVRFEKAKRIFEGDVLTVVDERFHYEEVREISIGMVEGTLLFNGCPYRHGHRDNPSDFRTKSHETGTKPL